MPDFFFAGHYRRLHCGRFNDAEQLPADSFIDRCSAKGDAARLTIIQPPAMTAIADDIMVFSCVMHCPFATTAPAAQ